MALFWLIHIKDILLDWTIPLIIIPSTDFILCKLFGTLSRWFQLHSAINIIIVYIIYDDVVKLIYNPIDNIAVMNSKLDFYFIVWLHIYHVFISKLTLMDYFHHILFIGGGCIPVILLYNINLVKLCSFTCCGLPGAIEYFTLALVKHKKIESLTQKKICTYIYNYGRYPFIIYSASLTYIAYKQEIIKNYNPWLIVYVNILLLFNGSFYNKLTIENYMEHKLRIKNN
jgi:hypothetical protein